MKNYEIKAQFLMGEFNSLQQRANTYEEIKSKRVNFFLLTVAGMGAICSAIIGNSNLFSYIIESIIAISLFIGILGFLTLRMLIHYSVAIVIFYRKSGRIRRWFTDIDPSLKSYVAFEDNDDKPAFTMEQKFLHWRGAETILVLINSVMVSILSGTLVSLQTNQLYIILPLAMILGTIFWYVQIMYTQQQLRKAEKSEYLNSLVNFPSNRG